MEGGGAACEGSDPHVRRDHASIVYLSHENRTRLSRTL